MPQCPTMSGSFRCPKEAGHDKDGEQCEAQAPEYAKQTEFVKRNGFWFDFCTKHQRTKFDDRGCISCAEAST